MTFAKVCDDALLYSTKKDRFFHKAGQTRTARAMKNVLIGLGINLENEFFVYNSLEIKKIKKIINMVFIFETLIFLVTTNFHPSIMGFPFNFQIISNTPALVTRNDYF